MPGGPAEETAENSTRYPAAGAPGVTRDVTWDVLSTHINDLIILADTQGVLFYVSPACRRLGYSQQEMIGRTAADFVHPDDLAHFQANTAAFLAGETLPAPADREHRVRCKDGSWIWMEGAPSLLPSGSGAPVGIINAFRDVTDRRAVREALAQQTQRAAMAEAVAGVGYWRFDALTREFTCSEEMHRIYGKTPERELRLDSGLAFIHPDDREAAQARVTRALETGEGWSDAIARIIRLDGETRHISGRGVCETDAAGRVTAVFGTIMDITEQHALKERLREALAQAEKAAQVKAEFLANMSHEIRTPLTAVLGFTSLLEERGDLDAEAQGQVARIAGAGRGLLAIVNDVLDFSELEAGEANITLRPTDAAAAAREALELFEAQAAVKGLAMRFQSHSSLPARVRLDGERLRQILLNLIGNAVKFTERGGVTVRLTYDGNTERLSVEVADTGPGIAASARDRLFERFSQVDGSSTRANGGTGLGLAICRRLAQAMGGEVTLRSRVGHGSTFRLELPAPPAEAAAEADGSEAEAMALEGLRVLVADDNRVNRDLARAILEPSGVEVSEARNGDEAVAMAQAMPVDLILMDLRMPGQGGCAAAQAIRLGDGPNRDVPILAFSADYDLSEGRRGAAPLFNGQIRKPVAPAALLAAVRAAMSEDFVAAEEEIRRVAS